MHDCDDLMNYFVCAPLESKYVFLLYILASINDGEI